MSESLLDLSVVCLVCLRGEDIYYSIYSHDPETPEYKIVDKIEYCSNLILSERILQKVPDRICAICLNELCATWRFRKKCEATNQLYQSMHDQDLEAEAAAAVLANATLEEHKLKLSPCVRVRCGNSAHLTLKLPTKLKLEPPSQTHGGDDDDDVEFVESKNNSIIEDAYNVNKSLELPMPPLLKVFKYENVNQSLLDEVAEEEEQKEEKAPTTPQPFECAAYDAEEELYDAAELSDTKEIDDHDDDDDDEDNDTVELISEVKIDVDDVEKYTVAIPTPKIFPKRKAKRYSAAIVHQIKKSPPVTPNYGRSVRTNKSKHTKTSIISATASGTGTEATASTIITTTKTTAAAATLGKQRRATIALDNLKENNNDNLVISKRKKSLRPLKICDICGNTYKYQHKLNAHMRRHNNERPYPCEVCSKAFVSNVELRRHMRVHTGQKPYACTYCDRRFSDFGSSKKHERTHTGERPYICDICQKGFAYAHVLTVHKRTHTGEKQFPCPHCTKGFTKKAYLLTHIEKHKRTAKRLSQFSGIIRDVELNKCEMDDDDDDDNEDDVNIDVDNDDDDDDDVDNCNNNELNGITDGAGILLKEDKNVSNNTLNAVVSAFEEDKVLEECIVASDFMIDGDGACIVPDSGTDHHHGVVYDVELNTDFLDSEHLD